MYSRCSCLRDKLKEDSKYKCETVVNQQTDTVENYPGIELNASHLKL